PELRNCLAFLAIEVALEADRRPQPTAVRVEAQARRGVGAHHPDRYAELVVPRIVRRHCGQGREEGGGSDRANGDFHDCGSALVRGAHLSTAASRLPWHFG